MVDIYGSHFEYGGIYSRQYGLIFANFETQRNRKLSGDAGSVTVYDKRNTRQYYIDTDYSKSPVLLDVEIMTDDQTPLSKQAQREIEKWLFNRGQYQKLYIAKEDDPDGQTIEIVRGEEKRLYLNCRFTQPERIEYNGGVIGYKAVIETDCGFWWQDPIVQAASGEELQEHATQGYYLFVVDVDTDIDDYTYPEIHIQSSSIKNNTIRVLSYHDGIKEFDITLDHCGNDIAIYSEINGLYGVTYDNMTGQKFPRLVDKTNNVRIYGDNITSVSIQYQNRRNL